MKVLLDTESLEKLNKNIVKIKDHPDVEFFMCREVVASTIAKAEKNKKKKTSFDVIALTKAGVKYVKSEVFVFGYSKLDADSHENSKEVKDIYKKLVFGPNSVSDAMIATTAVINKYSLITGNKKLSDKVRKLGCEVVSFEELMTTNTEQA